MPKGGGVGRGMQVEIWSDVVCPWCFIGKHRFESALARFEHRDQVQVVFRSFELDPSAPAHQEGSSVERLAAKYGMSLEQAQAAVERVELAAEREGLLIDHDRMQRGNTFDAHRVIHFAAAHDVQHEMKERLMTAYFSEGRRIGERETLVDLATEVGLDPAEVRAMLDSDDHRQAVRDDEAAASTLGISGVPFFVVDRAYGVSGAQNEDLFLEVLDTAWAETHPVAV
jgi:predicted DsbA family dithiol-disulfide isomerase